MTTSLYDRVNEVINNYSNTTETATNPVIMDGVESSPDYAHFGLIIPNNGFSASDIVNFWEYMISQPKVNYLGIVSLPNRNLDSIEGLLYKNILWLNINDEYVEWSSINRKRDLILNR